MAKNFKIVQKGKKMKKKIIYFIKKSRDYLIYISRKRNEIKKMKIRL